MDKQTMMLVVVIILVVLSGVQAVQIKNLKSEIAGGGLSLSEVSSNSAGGTSIATKYAQQAPTMVGGC